MATARNKVNEIARLWAQDYISEPLARLSAYNQGVEWLEVKKSRNLMVIGNELDGMIGNVK